MLKLHDSRVAADEIDSLGHLNVRHYLERMDAGIGVLLADLKRPAGAVLRRVDTYSRFRREQFEGAALEVWGGVLDLGEQGLRSYIEIRNAENGDVAACFVAVAQLVDPARQAVLGIPPDFEVSAPQRLDAIPRHGQPRTLSLAPPRVDLSIDMLDAVIPDAEDGAVMTGKYFADVLAQDVDANGWLKEDIEVMFLPFHRAVQSGGARPGPPVFETRDGLRVGLAMMETRTIRYHQARLGDRVRYFGADLALSGKSRHSRRWAFAEQTGALLGISDSVGVCIDLGARRAIDMPEEMRNAMSRHLLPELA